MSHLDIAEHLFRAHPNEWLSTLTFEAACGRCAWRSRIAELRTQRGMVIENRQRCITRVSGPGIYRISEYRFVPPPTQAEPTLDLLMVAEAQV